MKNYTQVYVKNSFEAAETYCKAFGTEVTREFKRCDFPGANTLSGSKGICNKSRRYRECKNGI